MGNQVGVCRDPPQIAELFSTHPHNNDQNFGKLNDKQPHDDGFRSYLQIWRFYSDNTDEVAIKNTPVRFAQFKKFESKDCYIALHVIKNNTADYKSMSPRSTDSPKNTNHNPTLCDLLASSMEELTPRGTSCSFGTLNLEPFIQNTTDDFTHDLYVWNGKNSSSLAKAVALAKGFEIERILMQDKLSGALYHLFSRIPKAALSSHFVDDLASIKQDSRLQFDHYKYENNHIYKQLLGTNRKPISSIKIGELFGSPADGPRYEVLKKLMQSQPNGLGATKSSDQPTKHPNPTIINKAPTTKIPLLNLSKEAPTVPSTSSTFTPIPPIMKVKSTPSVVPPFNTERVTVIKVRSESDLTPTSPKTKTEDYGTMKQAELRAIFEPLLSRILDNLFLGGQKPAMDKAMLQDAGITHVLNCAGGACKNYFPEDFTYKTYDIGDGVTEDIACLFYESLEFIEEAVKGNGKVLIHCHQGISRSSAFVLCYLMWKNNWGFRQAYDFIKELRYIASPNPGFIGQLMVWRKTLDKDKDNFATRMFQVIQHSNTLIVPKQVEKPGSIALDPSSCYIIQVPSNFYYWIGEKCPSLFVDAAKKVIISMQRYEDLLGVTVTEVRQGSESDEFWQSLGEVPNVAL